MTYSENIFTDNLFKTYLRHGKNTNIRLYRFSENYSIATNLKQGDKFWCTSNENAIKYYNSIKKYNIGVNFYIGTYIYISDRYSNEFTEFCNKLSKYMENILPDYLKTLQLFATSFGYTYNCTAEYYSCLIGILIKFELFPKDICCTILCSKKIDFRFDSNFIEYIIHGDKNTNIDTEFINC